MYVRTVNPNMGGYPPCPLKAVTGIDCPGCGGLRCVHALANGDLLGALDQNLLAVLLLPLVVIWLFVLLRARWNGESNDAFEPSVSDPAHPNGVGSDTAIARNAAIVRMVIMGTIVAMVIFTLLRNIPGMPFLPSGIG
jgi:hypothetical protein